MLLPAASMLAAANAQPTVSSLPNNIFTNEMPEFNAVASAASSAVAPASSGLSDDAKSDALKRLAVVANEAEKEVESALRKKISEENEHADAFRDYDLNPTASNKEKLDDAQNQLFAAKRAFDLSMRDAGEARKAFLQARAAISINDELSLAGLDTMDGGTGIPGGLDEIGANAAKLFLPDHKLSTAEAKLELAKLKFEYKKRKTAIEAWEEARVAESEVGFLDPSDLKVLKRRVKDRLVHAKNKTD